MKNENRGEGGSADRQPPYIVLGVLLTFDLLAWLCLEKNPQMQHFPPDQCDRPMCVFTSRVTGRICPIMQWGKTGGSPLQALSQSVTELNGLV